MRLWPWAFLAGGFLPAEPVAPTASHIVRLGDSTATDGSRAAKITDLEYGQSGGEKLLLDASRPAGPGPFPVAILVHGGG